MGSSKEPVIIEAFLEKAGKEGLVTYHIEPRTTTATMGKPLEYLAVCRNINLVTGRCPPETEEEQLVYNAWLEYRVKMPSLLKSFDAFHSIRVNQPWRLKA